ncbi:MAG: hypothetical protein ACJAS9_003691 [Polaribacter sp.]|jgi:hypothetical protein
MYKKFVGPMLYTVTIVTALLTFNEINNVTEISSEQIKSIDAI